jgi:hypothetical protein
MKLYELASAHPYIAGTIYTVIALIAVAVIGVCFYIALNEWIDRFQGWKRRKTPMAISMSAEELVRNRQKKAAARRLRIRVDNSVLNAERKTPKIPFSWEGTHK